MLIISGGGGGPLRPYWRGGEVLIISGGGPLRPGWRGGEVLIISGGVHLDQAGGEVRC